MDDRMVRLEQALIERERLADPVGRAQCELRIAAVLRELGDLRRARAAAEAAQPALPGPAHLELARIAVVSARYGTARGHLRSAQHLDGADAAAVQLLRATCACRGPDATFDEALRAGATAARQHPSAELAALAELCADRCRGAGHGERAQAAYALARELWRRVGEPEKVEAMTRALARC